MVEYVSILWALRSLTGGGGGGGGGLLFTDISPLRDRDTSSLFLTSTAILWWTSAPDLFVSMLLSLSNSPSLQSPCSSLLQS